MTPLPAAQINTAPEIPHTFHAIDHSPANLQQAIEKAPPTLDTAISSFKTQQPFLADFADLSRRLRPVAATLPHTLPATRTRSWRSRT